MPKLNTIGDLESMANKIQHSRRKAKKTITLCGGTGCQASQSQSVIDAVKKELVKQSMETIAKYFFIKPSLNFGAADQVSFTVNTDRMTVFLF